MLASYRALLFLIYQEWSKYTRVPCHYKDTLASGIDCNYFNYEPEQFSPLLCLSSEVFDHHDYFTVYSRKLFRLKVFHFDYFFTVIFFLLKIDFFSYNIF